MAKLHRVLAEAGVPADVIAQMPGMSGPEPPATLPVLRAAGLTPIQDLAIELALLALFVPRLARPTLRAVGELAPPRIATELWHLVPTPAPPRLVVPP